MRSAAAGPLLVAGRASRQVAIRADDRRSFERQLAGGRRRQRKCRSGLLPAERIEHTVERGLRRITLVEEQRVVGAEERIDPGMRIRESPERDGVDTQDR